MGKTSLRVCFLTLLGLGSAFSTPQEDHPSLASKVLATYAPVEGATRTVTARAEAARAFLAALDEEERVRCGLALEDPERGSWTNVPSRASDGGARLGDLSPRQLERMCDLLANALSRQGYEKVRDIMLADDRLLSNGAPRPGFGAEEFHIALFGEPSTEGRWALQLDGHHIGLNLTFEQDRITMSPSFIGTQPAVYEREEQEILPLRGEVDDGFALVNALSEAQRAQAIVAARRGRLVSGPGTDGRVPEPVGLSCKGLDEDQRVILRRLLRHYVGDLPESSARLRMQVLELEIDRMTFAWSGPTDNPSDVSYHLQGPSVLIEYACQDLGGNPLDHLHSMYRDPRNEYGAGF